MDIKSNIVNAKQFFLKSHIYVRFGENNDLLVYNTLNGKFIETYSAEVFMLVKELYEPVNLGVALLDISKQQNTYINEFLLWALESESGDVNSDSQNSGCLIPILNLQKDVDKLIKDEERSIGEDLMNYLLELNIYINDSCDKKCSNCNNYCKQVSCCTTTNTYKELPPEKIEELLHQVKYSALSKINISGGNILQYSWPEKLKKVLAPVKNLLTFHINYKNYENNKLFEDIKLNLIVNFPIDKQKLHDVISQTSNNKTTVSFIIENENMYTEAEELIENLGISNNNIQPFYNGQNIEFFENNVYMDREDIFSSILSMREIFRNQKLNSNFFGSLCILPDGTTKANMNTEALGNITDKPILGILYSEMLNNTAWRKIRDAEPCSTCVYQFICPAPSNYENVSGVTNMCRINT